MNKNLIIGILLMSLVLVLPISMMIIVDKTPILAPHILITFFIMWISCFIGSYFLERGLENKNE